MNRSKNKTSSPNKQKSPKPLIRSNAFRKKFDEGMPRINQKVVQFHNLYDIDLNNKTVKDEKGLQFWGCVIPEKRKFKKRQNSNGEQTRFSQTRGQTIFKKYMRRRPSLTLTPRSYEFESQEKTNRKYETITDFRPDKAQQQRNPEASLKNGEQNQQNFMITKEDISAINKKSLYQMTPKQLQISIEWKKKFLQLFQNKLKDAKNYQYKFKPYGI